ncbi:hypothetical protein LJ754_03895 [Arthrobacter sp. zg-Y40]|uniref:hypothetical protein n=1 Tax=Arthrobacter sp. zg-Y40 TaxID=2886939 RepID=UPI001D1548C0|nr:hypothetical protein [Arthrobacter sp. zg-Y40]MCC3278300.1 hypothetical protein [Arthrobacter sp. zg-Y40]
MTQNPQNPTPPVADGGMAVPPPPPGAPGNAAPAAPYFTEPYRTAPDPVSPRRNYALFAGAGLVVGLGAGFLFAQIDFSSEPEPSMALTDAVRGCGLTNQEGIELGDEGQSLTMDSEGDDDFLSEAADEAQIDCVLRALNMPDAVDSRMDHTRALDGRQSAQWDEFAASWSYHPDSGMNVVIEILEPSED